MDEEYQRMAANSIAHEAFCAGQAWQQAAAARERPSVLWKPSLFRDGNQWCALLGENIQDGVVGFGDSPDAAMWAFDEAWREKLPPTPDTQPTPVLKPENVSFIDTSQLEGVVSTEIVHSYPPPSGWLRAIDEALVVAHIGVANADDTYEQAKAKLNNLIGFHVNVATDPAVNGGWKLVPIEPTETFYQCFSAYDGTSYSNPFDYDAFVKDWREALAAAPEAKP